MGTRFRGFPQTPRGRGFSLLGFYTLFKFFSMFRLAWGLKRPFDWSQNLGPNCLNLLKPFVKTVVVRGCYGLFLVANLCIYVLMYVLVCMRPELAVKPGFTK